MPSLALRPCPVPGCPALTPGGRCKQHRYEQQGGSAAQRGYDADWRRVRLQKLQVNPLCEECERHERITLGQEVDHKVPISEGGERLDLDNLQTLCKPCHSRKTMHESKQKMARAR